MKADSNIEQEIASTIDRFVDAYSRRDLGALTASFAPDDDIVMYGTGQDERRCQGLARSTPSPRVTGKRCCRRGSAVGRRGPSGRLRASCGMPILGGIAASRYEGCRS